MTQISKEDGSAGGSGPSVSRPGRVQFELYSRLRLISGDVSNLESGFKHAAALIAIIDDVSDHQADLDDVTYAKVIDEEAARLSLPAMRVNREMTMSVVHVRGALSAVEGQYTGALKSETEDRLAQHLSDSQDLMAEVLGALNGHHLPRKPFLIRQVEIGDLLRQCEPVDLALSDVRAKLDAQALGAEVIETVVKQQATVSTIKSSLERWHGKPNQKVARKVSTAGDIIADVTVNLQKLRGKLLAECAEAGIELYGRAGRFSKEQLLETARHLMETKRFDQVTV